MTPLTAVQNLVDAARAEPRGGGNRADGYAVRVRCPDGVIAFLGRLSRLVGCALASVVKETGQGFTKRCTSRYE